MRNFTRFVFFFILILSFILFNSCKKIKEFNQDPDIEPLHQGIKTTAAIGYCTSLAVMAFKGESLPENVIFRQSSGDYSVSGVLYVDINENNPLPFNKNVGQIIIAGIWDNQTNGGVLSMVFADIDIFADKFKFYGIHTVPVIEAEDETILTFFAEQDIIIGEGSDTILNLSLSRPQFNTELSRLDSEQPSDMFVAVEQNVWFINIDQNNLSNFYDDTYIISGGGQMAEASDDSVGIGYHAMIKSEFNFGICMNNPVNGHAFIQKLKAGDDIDFDHITLSFHENCDGKAFVEAAIGQYFLYNRRNVKLNLN